MSEQIFRLFATVPPLTEQERREVADEVARVRVTANPSGPLGEYAALLLDARVRGVPLPVALPPIVRRRYSHCPWFATSLNVLDAFAGQLRRDRR